ncbi:MAG TPA: peptidylprolyl isomerase [Roseiarcus sp.]|nr:peptidylprolyl isomerase [Roseiarcus sp.]
MAFTFSAPPGSRLAALALGLATAAAIGVALADSKVLATVDGDPITQDDLTIAIEDIGPGLPQGMEGPARDKYVLDYLIDMKLVAKKAAAEKLADTPDFARRVDYSREKLLMEALLGNVAKAAETDEAERKVYEEAAKAQPPQPEIHARHILVATEDEAKAALARVKGGEDFAKVATELSKDPGSEGGDLGWFTKDKMVPEFAEAAFKLEPGQVSDPVKSQFGWHIIKVEEKRMKAFPPFDQVKDQAARYVGQKAQSELITQLRKDAKIERTAEADKPADASSSAAPAEQKKP